MANLEVKIHGSFFSKPLTIRVSIGTNSPKTHISRRLADQLGLTLFQPAWVGDFHNRYVFTWKLSLFPIFIINERHNLKSNVFPIVNCKQNDAFYDMIIGQDLIGNSPDEYFEAFLEEREEEEGNFHLKPSFGPSFQPNKRTTLKNLYLVNIRALDQKFNGFYEFDCTSSTAISRMAINLVTRQLIVMYQQNPRIYRYATLTKELEEGLITGESLGLLMKEVRDCCPWSEIEDFPSSQLVGFANKKNSDESDEENNAIKNEQEIISYYISRKRKRSISSSESD